MKGDPGEVWEQFFAGHKPRPDELYAPLKKLLKAGDHEGAIEFLQAAIRHGQGRTWMYEVLPLEMRLANRPKEEVERAMLSRLDYTSIDLPNMMLSAAYLARFEQYVRALQLYRQASTLGPSRPEPYAMGLRLAQKNNDVDGIRWATTGILTHVWTKGHEQLHREARDAAINLEENLRRAGKKTEANQFAKSIAEANSRDLVLELKWQGNSDLDLVIEEPTGTRCSLQNPLSPAGGVLVHDGMGPDQKDTYEKIVYPRGISGSYRVRIRHVWGGVVAKRAVLTITRHQGTGREKKRTKIISVSPRDTVVQVVLKEGRRSEILPVSQLQQNLSSPVPVRPTVGLNQSSESRGLRRQFLKERGRTTEVRRGGARRGGAGFQPVTSVISEGTSLSASATVSGDRRYVRLRLAPSFSTITDVFTFSFLNSGRGPAQNARGGGQGNAQQR